MTIIGTGPIISRTIFSIEMIAMAKKKSGTVRTLRKDSYKSVSNPVKSVNATILYLSIVFSSVYLPSVHISHVKMMIGLKASSIPIRDFSPL